MKATLTRRAVLAGLCVLPALEMPTPSLGAGSAVVAPPPISPHLVHVRSVMLAGVRQARRLRLQLGLTSQATERERFKALVAHCGPQLVIRRRKITHARLVRVCQRNCLVLPTESGVQSHREQGAAILGRLLFHSPEKGRDTWEQKVGSFYFGFMFGWAFLSDRTDWEDVIHEVVDGAAKDAAQEFRSDA